MGRLIPLLLLALAGCDDSNSAPSRDAPSAPSWQIGPTIKGVNYSKGCPPSFAQSFTIGLCEPHYVTRSTGSLEGKARIVLRFRIEAAQGVVIHGAKCPTTSKSGVTVYLQRKGDDWAADKADYRWWHKPSRIAALKPGEYEIIAPLNPGANWSAALGAKSAEKPEAFQAALRNAGQVGFTFSNCEGLGHGAAATGNVTFTVLDWGVE